MTVSDELLDYRGQTESSELVFPSANSTPLRNRNFRRDSFDPAAAALGLKLTPHNLRDTAASLAIQAGASVVAVARLLGHESAATTLNHYAGLFPPAWTTSRYASTPPQDRPSRNNECHVALVVHRPQI
jgi:integrase